MIGRRGFLKRLGYAAAAVVVAPKMLATAIPKRASVGPSPFNDAYGTVLILNRRHLFNDDLDAFTTIPHTQANSAARKEGDVAYAVLTGNASR